MCVGTTWLWQYYEEGIKSRNLSWILIHYGIYYNNIVKLFQAVKRVSTEN